MTKEDKSKYNKFRVTKKKKATQKPAFSYTSDGEPTNAYGYTEKEWNDLGELKRKKAQKAVTDQITKKESAPMFEVDAAGYRAQMAEMKPIKTVYEIIAKANDEDSVKEFSLNIEWLPEGNLRIGYKDDGAGFKKVSDVWTMYGHSERRSDPTKSGRFNLGEKEFENYLLYEHILNIIRNSRKLTM